MYDRFARLYDRMLAPLERRFLARWRREALSRLPADARLLEIGAGTGLNFAHYPACRLGVACDLSAEMLALAASRAGRIELVRADAEDLPFPAGSFDAAVATLVFCSVPDPAQAFAELRRVLKAGDRIVLLEHVRPEGLLGYIFDVLNVFTVALFDDRFNRRTASIAAGSGLRVVEIGKRAFGIVNLIVCEVGEEPTTDNR